MLCLVDIQSQRIGFLYGAHFALQIPDHPAAGREIIIFEIHDEQPLYVHLLIPAAVLDKRIVRRQRVHPVRHLFCPQVRRKFQRLVDLAAGALHGNAGLDLRLCGRGKPRHAAGKGLAGEDELDAQCRALCQQVLQLQAVAFFLCDGLGHDGELVQYHKDDGHMTDLRGNLGHLAVRVGREEGLPLDHNGCQLIHQVVDKFRRFVQQDVLHMGRQRLDILLELRHFEICQPEFHIIGVIIADDAGDQRMQQRGFARTGSAHDIGSEHLVLKGHGVHRVVLGVHRKGQFHHLIAAPVRRDVLHIDTADVLGAQCLGLFGESPDLLHQFFRQSLLQFIPLKHLRGAAVAAQGLALAAHEDLILVDEILLVLFFHGRGAILRVDQDQGNTVAVIVCHDPLQKAAALAGQFGKAAHQEHKLSCKPLRLFFCCPVVFDHRFSGAQRFVQIRERGDHLAQRIGKLLAVSGNGGHNAGALQNLQRAQNGAVVVHRIQQLHLAPPQRHTAQIAADQLAQPAVQLFVPSGSAIDPQQVFLFQTQLYGQPDRTGLCIVEVPQCILCRRAEFFGQGQRLTVGTNAQGGASSGFRFRLQPRLGIGLVRLPDCLRELRKGLRFQQFAAALPLRGFFSLQKRPLRRFVRAGDLLQLLQRMGKFLPLVLQQQFIAAALHINALGVGVIHILRVDHGRPFFQADKVQFPGRDREQIFAGQVFFGDQTVPFDHMAVFFNICQLGLQIFDPGTDRLRIELHRSLKLLLSLTDGVVDALQLFQKSRIERLNGCHAFTSSQNQFSVITGAGRCGTASAAAKCRRAGCRSAPGTG